MADVGQEKRTNVTTNNDNMSAGNNNVRSFWIVCAGGTIGNGNYFRHVRIIHISCGLIFIAEMHSRRGFRDKGNC